MKKSARGTEVKSVSGSIVNFEKSYLFLFRCSTHFQGATSVCTPAPAPAPLAPPSPLRRD